MVYDYFEVTTKDILDLASPDAFALFFAKLGYNTKSANYDSNATKMQLHHDTDLLDKIRICRQLVEHSDETFSRFYVYLYVLSTLNKTITRNIFRDLCKRQGDFLVVLTNETYETIDIMYIDRSTSIPTVGQVGQPTLIDFLSDVAPPKLGKAEARIITIDRRHPGKVALRVLNRFHWRPRQSVITDDENLQKRSIAAHCETLQSAYIIAEWSQEYFNNRALFSDHYLINTLPNQQEGEWKATTGSGKVASQFTKSYASLRRLYDDAYETFSQQPYEELCQQLISPVLNALDFVAQPSAKDKTKKRLPTYNLFVKDSTGQPTSKVAICLAYAWGRNLDGYEEVANDGIGSIDETAHENPGAVIVTLLDQEKIDWAILTNGKIWRLYAAKTHSSATNYYEIDLEETLAIPRDHAKEAGDALRYFWLLFRADAFIAREQPGYKEPLSFLDYLLRESEAYAIALGNSLKKKIFEQIFTHFAEGLVHNAQSHGILPSNLSDLTSEQLAKLDKQLKPFFNATLTFLYRLLFLLYAESRNLLPLHINSVYYQHCLQKLKQDIAERAGENDVQAVQKIEQYYSESSYTLYDALQTLFAAIDKGREDLNVPTYNGGLFITHNSLPTVDSPEAWEKLIKATTSEEVATHILATYKISDRHLALGLDKLARDEDNHHNLVAIDYKSLGVRQLGSIYEGLLEFKLRIASEDMVEIKEKIIPLREAQGAGHYKPGKQPILLANSVYIENDRHERKATGSYYTPDYIVQYIVEQTVGPILDEKEITLLKKFREFEAAILQKHKENKDFVKRGMQPKDLTGTYNMYSYLVDEFFDIKVLDPAMGSGHFLVEAVDYITRRMIKFLDRVPVNPVRYQLKAIETSIVEEMERQRVNIDRSKLTEINLLKRQVLKRCIYGVDLNPMAVELAKVSVWLDSFTLGAPLSFLDHHLKCGNSLIGAKVDEARTAIEEGQLSLFFGGGVWAGALLSTEGMLHVSKLSDVTPGQAQESKEKYQESATAIAPYKHLLNVYLSRWFSNPIAKGKKGKADVDKALDFLRSNEAQVWINERDKQHLNDEQQIVLTQAEKDHADHKFFHWELEFPEVFIDLAHASLKTNPGFDAVIGNPPYVRQEGLGDDKIVFKAIYEVHNNIADLYTYFIERGHTMLHRDGRFGMITANKFMRANYGAALREFLMSKARLEQLIDFGELRVFGDAATDPLITISSKNTPSDTVTYVQVKSLEFNTLNDVVKTLAIPLQKKALSGSHWSLTGMSQQAILDKLQRNTISLKEYSDNGIKYGIKTGFNEAFIIDKATCDSLIAEDPASIEIIKPFLVGDDVRRYYEDFKEQYVVFTRRGIDIKKYPAIEKYLLLYREQLEPRPLDWNNKKHGEWKGRKPGPYKWYEIQDNVAYYRDFEKAKIVYPDISMSSRFVLDRDGHYTANTTYIIPTNDTFLLALLNSSLIWMYLKRKCTALGDTDDGGRLRMFSIFIEALPIRRINFITSDKDRAFYLEKAKLLYNQCMSKDDQDCVLGFVNHHLSQEPEASDIVHDLLAFLAEEMLRLNKEKRASQRAFLDWLVDTLKIQPQPDKDGKVGIDALKHKAKLLDYPGDYQKGEDALKFAEVKSILLENKKRLLVSLNEALLAKVEQSYQHSLDTILPLKRQLAQTDKLIDRVVYRLYGLTEEEIRVVEGQA